MKRIILLILLCISTSVIAKDCVILLHGLARGADSMQQLEDSLEQSDYTVANIDYPSRKAKVEFLADLAINEGIYKCRQQGAQNINFVTHSMGGILVRYFLDKKQIDNLGRVVMLGPPNKGSEVVDELRDLEIFEWINGPAGQQLGTGQQSLVNQLGAVDFELGIIAGTKTINWILSTILPNQDDGKVTVESTKIDGMCSFIKLPVTHTFMMMNDVVERQVISYLKTGHFAHSSAQNNLCFK
ncbi:esterase/lipase family protein [Catenovulum adriaticum]|uniref:Alpha/beta hydrolase n=1 Tax=Catenovulum adriaticum TaxID=2984846 RepID=A0ABY7ARD8_9ALTE|nr:alpha/beta hydrolase [Catenovulum sp. TS8]WAJ70909.1 alpha/beta hydrolase [Catenovulum sp. TS8]